MRRTTTITAVASLLTCGSLAAAQAPGAAGKRPDVPPRAQPAGGCEILLPPGAQQATFQGTFWSARLVPFGPLVLGAVPFEFDANVNALNQSRALASMAEIERVCDVDFIPRNPSLSVHPNWIHIQDGAGNSSFIGMIGGQQDVTITSWAQNQPNVNFVIVHELLHALGFWHEHQRPNRDTFVRINDGTPAPEPQCILAGSAQNFDINLAAATIGPYDFGSVMHYPEWAFSNMWPGCPTIVVLPPNDLLWQAAIGQRVQLSPADIDGLCTQYGCAPANDACANAIAVTNGTTITDSRWANTSAGVGCPALQRDVWYVYDATCLGQVTMSLDNPSAGYAPAMAVYEDPCAGGPLVECDTAAPIAATFPASPGERFLVRVGGTSGTMGTARLQIACAPITCATGLQWAQVAAGDPGFRYDHAMVYDSARQRVVLFGGILGGVANGETWEWDGAAQTWTLRSTGGPPPRFSHAMAYDSARQRVVLFGGHNGSTLLGDTWEYDGATNVWTDVTSAGPAARVHMAMAYDSARQRVVLFGGASGIVHNDTWERNGAAGTWAQRTPTGTIPPGRYDFGMAYDSTRQRTVMWGGYNFFGLISDASVREWNGSSWAAVAAAAPPVRGGHELVFDSAYDQVLLFGGYDGAFPNDLWGWNGTAWNNQGSSGGPAGRHKHAAAFDQSTAAMLVQGGTTGTLQSDTWRALIGLPNDDVAGAQLVGNGTIPFDNRCASNGTGGCASSRDLWYRFDAAVSGTLTASVTGASFAAQVAIYAAANPSSALACGTGTPPVATALVAPGSYLIRVGSASASGGVGNLVVNGQPQPCPPVFDITDFDTFEHRLFEVSGTASGLPWAWSVKRGGDVMFELNAPGVTPGGSASVLAAAFVASINAHSCADNRLLAVQINPPHTNMFRVIVGGSTSFSLCMGPAGQAPTCCLPAAGYCPFNPDVREIALSGADCDGNGLDDTIDILLNAGSDVDENGVLDACEACVADLGGDGTVGFADLIQVLSSWGECDDIDCVADLDGDGMVAFGDLILLLSSWGPCEGAG